MNMTLNVCAREGYGANECDDALIPDTVNRCKTIREVYELAKVSNPCVVGCMTIWCRGHRRDGAGGKDRGTGSAYIKPIY
jgi:hypothetical protein